MSSSNSYNITISDYSDGEENKELHENLPQSHTNFDGFNNIFLKVPEPKSSSYRTRKSTVSKVSVEEFLKKLEKNGQNFTPRNFNEILKYRNGKKNHTIFDNVIHFLHSQHFYIIQIVLVVLDIIFVLIQIVCDIILKDNGGSLQKMNLELKNGTNLDIIGYLDYVPHNHLSDRIHLIEHISEICSAFILGLVICLALVKIIFECKEFFKSKLEMFDTIIVSISFGLEIFSVTSKEKVKEIDAAVVIFRFWRIIRIMNGLY
jgi:hypothetical protein